jgi:hypothetical protein
MLDTPKTEREWTIHSINIHGILFERWCQRVVSEAPGWRLDSTNYPVEFPPRSGPIQGKESTLDIRASKDMGELRLSLLIECKKNNPHFVDWVFFEKPVERPNQGFIASQVQIAPRVPPAVGWDTKATLQHLVTSFVVTDEARETRGNYLLLRNSGDKTKTSNAAIQEAAYQVSLAKQAISTEDEDISRRLGSSGTPPSMPWRTKIYFPTIVTTARLYVCAFDPKDIDPASGEIPPSKASISEREALVFEYPLPRHLEFNPRNIASAYQNEGLEDLFTRVHILIVQSQHLPQFLRTLYDQEPVKEETPTPPQAGRATDA